jgi:hypothetical protein
LTGVAGGVSGGQYVQEVPQDAREATTRQNEKIKVELCNFKNFLIFQHITLHIICITIKNNADVFLPIE